MVPALTAPAMPSCRDMSFLKYSSATSHARSGGFSSTYVGPSGLLGMGACIFGLKDERRDAEVPGRGGSPRREEVDDLRPKAGVEERKLATLGLRWTAFALKLGVEGVRRRSAELRGEFRAGDCGSGVFEAECRDRRLRGCERGFASLFVCRAPRGVPGLAAGLDRGEFCILAQYARDAGRSPSCLGACLLSDGLKVQEERRAMTKLCRVHHHSDNETGSRA
jgi:hypothetical protein